MSINVENDADFVNSYKQGEARNHVCFYKKWVRNNFKSQQEGREIGEEQDYILIFSPGQAKTEVRRKATDADKEFYFGEWSAYEAGKVSQVQGTPIEMLPGLPNGMADMLKSLYICTIEQMAGLADIALQKIGMGGNDLREKARAYLNGQTREAAALKEQLEAANIKIKTLETANAALQARVTELEATAKPSAPKPAKKPAAKKKPAGKTEPAAVLQ